ncbi:MAG: phosphatidate cytidylyltransferase [Actinobacteria bacterium]|nr:phosphatidate cytidylyltransferase [Actinomycetota bacterium]NDA94675.1 phosphatidate cytidylyltransferase [Actinomycetota bacterium]NDH80571.1 phosphatidate cytidylyltransferase [Actinomycetota bacterium]NDH99138.1 phosphatidate cytidylyltransferase [Actinomycetota bacterium]NDI08110.1 phosphatidate cytidylyltransferase [Actinomycetota bacterium]
MSDLHSINEAINAKAGRKLLPSILVSLTLIALVWLTLAYARVLFALLVAIAVALGIREIARAFAAAGTHISTRTLIVATGGLTYAVWSAGVEGLAIATAIALPVLLISRLRKGPQDFVKSATATTLALIYLPFLAGFLILLARPDDGLARVMTFVVLVGCNDTFGYLVGVIFGKHPLVPKISPKKSWEGLVGSIIFTSIGGALSFYYILDLQWWIGALVALMIVFTATSGDLIESAMKRDLSLKDMGSLLPGHGGMLDRLDSVLLSAPALYFALELVKRFS